MPEEDQDGSEGGPPVTTPGGVPNLPAGALTVGTMATSLQDTSTAAMRNRAKQRMPSIFDNSNGGNPLSDLTPFGILTKIFAGTNSAIANADPADIDGPEDLPALFLNFLEGLPVIGELVGLFEAILGTYDGDDEIILAIQQIFAPIRKLLQLITGQDVGFPTLDEIAEGWEQLGKAVKEELQDLLDGLYRFLTGDDDATDVPIGKVLGAIINPANWIAAFTDHLTRPITEWVTALLAPIFGDLADHKAKLSAIQLTLAGGTAKGAIYDCSDIDFLEDIAGDWRVAPGGKIIANGDGFAVGNVKQVMGSDDHGIGARLWSVRSGIARIGICSDAARTNYLALEWDIAKYGADTVRLVLGAGNNDVITLLGTDNNPVQVEANVKNDSVWEVFGVEDTDTHIWTYYSFHDGTELRGLRWTDNTGLILHGPTKRRVILLSNGEADHGDRWGKGPHFTDITVYDRTGAAPA